MRGGAGTGSAWLVGGQLLLIVLGLAALAFFPPAQGRMIIVPLRAEDGSGALNLALSAGARLVGPGPLRGSFVIEARRASISAALKGSRALLLAAPPAGCGQQVPA